MAEASETLPSDRHVNIDCAKNKKKWDIQEESKSIKEQNEDLKDLVDVCCLQAKKLEWQPLKRGVYRGWNAIKQIDWYV